MTLADIGNYFPFHLDVVSFLRLRQEMGKKTPKEKRDRETWAYFRTNGSVSEITCHVDGDIVTLENADPYRTKTEISYERASGKPKRISTLPSRDGTAGLHFENYLKENYRYLCAVDTNYIDFEGQRVAITAIYHCPIRNQSHTEELPIEFLASYLLLEPLQGLNPEVIGWHLALAHLREPSDGGTIGMVVDSEAGRIQDINSRKVPYLENHYLPPCVDLIYASADKKDCITNQFIRYCDQAASMILAELKSRRIEMPKFSPSDTELYKGIARIRTNNSVVGSSAIQP